MGLRLHLPHVLHSRSAVALGRLRSAVRRLTSGRPDGGMATAEYAIATLAACGFAGLLLTILRSGEVRGLLVKIIRSALSVG